MKAAWVVLGCSLLGGCIGFGRENREEVAAVSWRAPILPAASAQLACPESQLHARRIVWAYRDWMPFYVVEGCGERASFIPECHENRTSVQRVYVAKESRKNGAFESNDFGARKVYESDEETTCEYVMLSRVPAASHHG